MDLIPACDRPLVVLLSQPGHPGAHEFGDGGAVWEEAHHVGAVPDLAAEPLLMGGTHTYCPYGLGKSGGRPGSSRPTLAEKCRQAEFSTQSGAGRPTIQVLSINSIDRVATIGISL